MIMIKKKYNRLNDSINLNIFIPEDLVQVNISHAQHDLFHERIFRVKSFLFLFLLELHLIQHQT